MALVLVASVSACDGAKSTEGGQKVVTITAQGSGAATDEFSTAPEAEDEFSEETTTAETGGFHGVGESAEDDGLLFKVVSLKEVDEIPVGKYSFPSKPIRPVKGAKLVLAAVVWKNNTNQSADNFCGEGGAKLADEQDRNFDPIDRQIDIKGNTICSKDVQPGFKVKQYLAFQMPKDADIGGLALWNSNSEDDFLGDTFVVFVP
jgi:hypothetical protein